MVGFILFVPFGIRSIAPSFMQIRAEYLPYARHCETPETQKESHSPDFEELWTGKLTQKRKRHRKKERQGDIERERRGGKGRERAAALMWEHLSDSKILTVANISLPTAWHTAGNNPKHTPSALTSSNAVALVQTDFTAQRGRQVNLQTPEASTECYRTTAVGGCVSLHSANVRPRKQRVSFSRCPRTEGHLRTDIALFSLPCSFHWPF